MRQNKAFLASMLSGLAAFAMMAGMFSPRAILPTFDNPLAIPAPNRKRKAKRLTHRDPNAYAYPYSSARQDGRHKGWPPGPLNNREPISHSPRLVYTDDRRQDRGARFASIGGEGSTGLWGKGREINRYDSIHQRQLFTR